MRLGAFGELRLWHLTDGDGQVFVAAANGEHAVEVYVAHVGENFWPGNPKGPEIKEVSEELGRSLRFFSEDGRIEHHSIWEEFLLQTEPTVVASSDW